MEELPLRDIHLPDPISWWPPAIGYWIVLSLILIALAIVLFFVRKWLKTNVKKQAKSVLSSIENLYLENGDASLCIKELSILLRRVVISQKKEECPAGLTGNAWLQVLDGKLGNHEFSEGAGKVLLSGPYQSKVDEESVEKLLQLCHKWVEAL